MDALFTLVFTMPEMENLGQESWDMVKVMNHAWSSGWLDLIPGLLLFLWRMHRIFFHMPPIYGLLANLRQVYCLAER